MVAQIRQNWMENGMKRREFCGSAVAAAGSLVSARAFGEDSSARHSAEMTIVLTGQSLVINDIRLAGAAFRATAPLMSGDVVFTNFETTVREPGDSIAQLDPVSGTFCPPEALDALKEQGFNLLSMANNHIYDLHEPGLLASLRGAARRGLAQSGIGHNLAEATRPAYLKTAKGTVALVSMATGFLHGKGRATDNKPGLNELAIEGGDVTGSGLVDPADAERNLNQIREARRRSDLVIVSHHNHVYDRQFTDLMMERSPQRLRPPAWVKIWARREIDAGADIVVMHGAPFFQGVEVYKGKPILYDTGNYIFQVAPKYVDLFGPLAAESAVARVNFSGREFRGLALHPIVLDPRPRGTGAVAEAARGLPSPATGEKRNEILRRLVELSGELGTRLSIVDGAAYLIASEASLPAD